jgi:hypothetical protein
MRIASRPFARAGRSARGYFLTMLGVLVLGWAMTGCEDKHIGRPCETNADAGSSTGVHVSVVSSPVLSCPSRICLFPADTSNSGDATTFHDGAFCTATCSTDDDCSDGEIGDKGDSSDHRCKSNFVCAVATTAGPFCCQKFCICHDFVFVPSGGIPTPTACESPSTCENVH